MNDDDRQGAAARSTTFLSRTDTMRRRNVKHLILSSMAAAGLIATSLVSTPHATHAHEAQANRHMGFDMILGFGCWYPGCRPMQICCTGQEEQT